MTLITVPCPHWRSEPVVKRGKTDCGTQRDLCQNTACVKGSFLLDYRHRGCVPEVKQPIIDMSLNASGIRDTARVLHSSPNTVLHELRKKETALASVNKALGRTLYPDAIPVNIERAGEAEMDELWCFVGKKGTNAGCGMLLIITQEPSERLSLVAAQMRSFCSSKGCSSRAVSPAFLPMIGVHTPGIWTPRCRA